MTQSAHGILVFFVVDTSELLEQHFAFLGVPLVHDSALML